MRLKISGGRLFDPANGWEGVEQDLYIDQDRLVSQLSQVDRVINAHGQVVVAGGIDLHGQVASYGLHYLRLWENAPTPQEQGNAYAALGYTHIHEPFLTLNTANYVHRELAALPLVDTSASLVVNLRELDLWLKSPDRRREVGEALLFLLHQTRALHLSVREPFVRYRQDFYAHRSLRPEMTLEFLTALAQELSVKITLAAGPEIIDLPLPEPRCLHLSALGAVLQNEASLAAALGHLEKGATADMGLLPAAAPRQPQRGPLLIDLGFFQPLNLFPARPEDQGEQALSLALRHQGKQLAFSGAAIPSDPSTDYPAMFSWLWDKSARPQNWQKVTALREYSLSEWVWATRTMPAQVLGLTDRGHLGPGARADVALYDLPPEANRRQWRTFLGRCRTLIKGGEIIIDNFNLVRSHVKKTTWFRATEIPSGPLVEEICQQRSLRPEHLWVQPEMGNNWEPV